MTTNVQRLTTNKEAKEQLKAHLEQYLSQQPESIRSANKWMKRLEVAGLVIIVAAFLFALTVSFNWSSVSVNSIPAAWFLFVASILPTFMLFGVHAILLKAFPTVVLPGRQNQFVTGEKAVKIGWILIASSVIGAVVWGYLTLKIWTSDYVTMGVILGVVIGVGISVQFIFSIIRTISRRQ